MRSIKDSLYPVSKKSLGKRNMGLNLLASAKRPSGHQRNALLTIPHESCLNAEGYYDVEGSFCYNEWMQFETVECNFINWDDECADVYDLIINPMDYDDEDDDYGLLATRGQRQAKGSNFGYGVAAGASVGAILGLAAFLAHKKCCKKDTSDEFIRV